MLCHGGALHFSESVIRRAYSHMECDLLTPCFQCISAPADVGREWGRVLGQNSTLSGSYLTHDNDDICL